MSLQLSSTFKSGSLTTTALAQFWQETDSGAFDPQIPNLPLELLTQSISAAITEGSDTVAASANLWIALSAAITEGSDVVSAAAIAGDTSSLSAAITEGSDVVAANLNAIIALSAAITEGSDVVAGAAKTLISVSAAITEGSDVAAAALSVATTADISAAITEGSDSVAAVLSSPDVQPVTGGGFVWKGPQEPNYQVHAEYDAKPRRKRKKVTEPETIVLAPDLTVQTGIVAVRPAWDVMAELQQRADDAEQVRRDKLRQIALADDEWLMVA